MKNYFKSLPKQAVTFFIVYLILMGSLIYFAMNNQNTSHKNTSSKQNEIASTFSKEMAVYEEKKKHNSFEKAGKWKPSKSFLIIAISTASVFDIVIIVLWARHENRKRDAANGDNLRKKWTDQKWFWNIVAMGIVQPNNDNRIVLNWKNLLYFLFLMYLLKIMLFRYIEPRL